MLEASDLLNKVIIVGLALERSDGTEDLIQTHGKVCRVEGEMLYLERYEKSEFPLGFSIEAFALTKPGTYVEKSTGIEIINPDFVCHWRTNSDAPTEEILKNGFKGFTKNTKNDEK
ncbi:MAG: hypothetical protein P1V18_00510 [Candidatus Gracilibacteria bacterium]|nr:hypothetical protein [Candidatus Gracilibacteria bacterium]